MIIKQEDIDELILSKLKKEIFIYHTDTIYGIGCDAENKELVEKIREIKGRDNRPFSIIAPSFKWIIDNCKTTENELKKYLPGAYTLILKKKNPSFLSHVSVTENIGVRIPDHPFTRLLQKMSKPIITTSVNFSGEKPANTISEIPKAILDSVKYIVDDGILSGNPSKLVIDGKIIER